MVDASCTLLHVSLAKSHEILVEENPTEVRKGDSQLAWMDQNLIVSPPNIIEPSGDLIT
jgi:hypothetical protein